MRFGCLMLDEKLFRVTCTKLSTLPEVIPSPAATKQIQKDRKWHPRASSEDLEKREGVARYCPPVKKPALEIRSSASSFSEMYAAVPDDAERRLLIVESFPERRFIVVKTNTKLTTLSQLYPFLFTEGGVSINYLHWSALLKRSNVFQVFLGQFGVLIPKMLLILLVYL